MNANVVILKLAVCKYSMHRDFLKKCNAQDLQDFGQTAVDSQFLLHDRYQHVDAQGNPDLRLDCVDRCAVEGLDSQVLFDPLEEQFDLPSLVVQLGDHQCRQREVVGQEDESLARLGVDVADAANGMRILQTRHRSGEHDGLVASQSGGFVDQARCLASVNHLVLRADNEEGAVLDEAIEPGKVDIATIHDVESCRLQYQSIEGHVVGDFAAGNVHETRDIPAKIEKRMKFDGALSFAELRPREECQTQIDGGRVQCVGRLFQVHCETIVGIELPCSTDQHLGKVGVYPPVACFVGVGQRAACNVTSNFYMIEFGMDGAQTRLDVAKALAVGQLRESHAAKLVGTVEPLDAAVAVVSPNASIELVARQEIHQLRKNDPSGVHGQSPWAEWQSMNAQRLPASSNRKQLYSHRTYCLDNPYSNPENS